MSKKFIPLLSLLIVLVSCRNDGEVIEDDKINVNELRHTNKSSFKNENSALSDSSIAVGNSLDGEDPPIKHGGHWRNSE